MPRKPPPPTREQYVQAASDALIGRGEVFQAALVKALATVRWRQEGPGAYVQVWLWIPEFIAQSVRFPKPKVVKRKRGK